MQLTSVLVYVLSALAGAVAVAPPPCPSAAHIVAASGHGGLPHAVGLLQSTVQDFKAAIPGTDSFSLPYPKKDANRPLGIEEGVTLLIEYLHNYTTRCPHTPLILLGYSEGGIVIMNTLCGRSHIGSPFGPPLNSSYAKHIIATVTYGEETRIPNQPWNRGTCKTGFGEDPRGNPEGCKAFADNVRAWCDAPDPQCCGGDKEFTHFKYPMKYNNVSTQFVTRQFAKHMQVD